MGHMTGPRCLLNRRWQLLETESRIYDSDVTKKGQKHRLKQSCHTWGSNQIVLVVICLSFNGRKQKTFSDCSPWMWPIEPSPFMHIKGVWAGGLARQSQSRPTVARITGRPNHTLISDVPVPHWDYTWEEKIPHWGCEGIKWSGLEDGAACSSAGPGGPLSNVEQKGRLRMWCAGHCVKPGVC